MRSTETTSRELDEANRRLREANAQFGAMWEQGLYAARLDLKGAVVDVNRAAIDGCGLRREDIIGRLFWECGWWNRSPDIQEWVRNAVKKAVLGESFRGDSGYFLGDGTERVVDFASMPIKDESGRVIFVVVTGMDITERVQGERDRRAYEEERRRAEALAEVDRSKTAFFSNVSHEFRTPLTLMLGPIEDALGDRDDPLGAQQRERIVMVQRNGLRLQKLVNALLDFSRVEAGRIQAFYQSTDLASLTHDLASSFRSACEKSGLSLTVNTPALSEAVFVDHEMWEKIVLNLVSNAFKFTLDGGIKVDVTTDGNGAVLRVSDTGTGIPESELPLIFDRFHRVEGARGRTHEGTGIGLALVKGLVALHKGSVSVESTLGKGTTFAVRVPFGSAHLPQDRLEASRPQASTATRAEAFVSEALRWLPDGMIAEELDTENERLQKSEERPTGARAHVLLADDNADMRDYLGRLLATSYEVTAAADGEEALTAARRARPDLILSDVMMPRLDGFGLLHKLRSDPELRSVPVIFLSARAGDEAKVEGLQSGADDYLVKPFSARELRARVAANIELSRARVQFRELADNISQFAWMADAKGWIYWYNKRWHDYTGTTLEDMQGWGWQKVHHPEHVNRVVHRIRQSFETGTPWEDTFPLRGKDGNYRWFLSHALPIRNEAGDVIRWFGTNTDVTEQFETENALRESEQELRNARDAAEAALQDLRETQASLIEAEKFAALGRLVTGVAHEINNPVGICLTVASTLARKSALFGAEVARGGVKRSSLNDFLETSRDGSAQLVANLNRVAALIQSFKQVGEDQISSDQRTFDLGDLTRQILISDRSSLGLEERNLTLVIDCEPNLLINSYPGLWQQLLKILFLNSFVHAFPDGKEGTIAIKVRASGDASVEILFSDDGCGMSAEVRRQAFDPFFTTRRHLGSTGLGLHILHNIVTNRLGGRLNLDSRPGAGTKFQIILPRTR